MFFRTFILPLPLHPNRMRAAAINAGSVSLRRAKQRVDDRSRFYARIMATTTTTKDDYNDDYNDDCDDDYDYDNDFDDDYDDDFD